MKLFIKKNKIIFSHFPKQSFFFILMFLATAAHAQTSSTGLSVGIYKNGRTLIFWDIIIDGGGVAIRKTFYENLETNNQRLFQNFRTMEP